MQDSALSLELLTDKLSESQLLLNGVAQGSILNVISDSRKITNEDCVFVARKGLTKDGHEFLNDLQAKSQIKAFIVQQIPDGFQPLVPVLVVRDSDLAMALACRLLNSDPTKDALTIAVTGTNGKTTSSYLLYSFLKFLGRRPALNGTIKTEFEGDVESSSLTTPDFSVLLPLFSKFKKKGADSFVFEASSHALEQRRLLGLEIDLALFTNLSPEHLDYHQTMENYYSSKKKLFSELLANSSKNRKVAILPRDGAYGTRLVEELRVDPRIELWTWGEADPEEKHLQLKQWTTTIEGSQFQVKVGRSDELISYESSLIGRHNVENLLAVLCSLWSLGFSLSGLKEAVKSFSGVPGRLERVADRSIFVDYAHTPDALENVLASLRPLTKGKLKVVFGCGGDRDREKRPQMGSIAELYADEVFVTSDNPRTEDPGSIIKQILAGMQRTKPTVVEGDRRLAIKKSVEGLKPEDVLLIAGKGHEDYQIIGEKKIEFSDQDVVQSYIR